MSPLVLTLAVNLAVLVGLMLLLWILSLILRDASIVDPFWGMGFVILAWMTYLVNSSTGARPILLLSLTTLWGVRLSLHLSKRNWGHGEDRRYVSMREYHGPRFWWISLFTVFLLQGVLLWFIALPIQAALATSQPTALGWIDAVGGLVWLVGMFFETVGDWQLARFKADPAHAGRVLDRGLWRYTRHPNYFGDFCVWWGLYLIAVGGGAWWTIASPLAMSFLLMKVSGVALLESTIVDRRPEYAAYQLRTSPFFPWPPSNQPPQ